MAKLKRCAMWMGVLGVLALSAPAWSQEGVLEGPFVIHVRGGSALADRIWIDEDRLMYVQRGGQKSVPVLEVSLILSPDEEIGCQFAKEEALRRQGAISRTAKDMRDRYSERDRTAISRAEDTLRQKELEDGGRICAAQRVKSYKAFAMLRAAQRRVSGLPEVNPSPNPRVPHDMMVEKSCTIQAEDFSPIDEQRAVASNMARFKQRDGRWFLVEIRGLVAMDDGPRMLAQVLGSAKVLTVADRKHLRDDRYEATVCVDGKDIARDSRMVRYRRD